MSFRKFSLLLPLAFALIPLFSSAATGTIDSVNKYSEIMIDSLLGGTSQINWQPTGAGATTVTDSLITGYIWSESFGWITLDPTGEGVTNDGAGVLGGYAWGQNVGWINFDPTGGGVSIHPTTGVFSGYAWGQNTGWIEFDCGSATACVQTDWAESGGGGGSGGGPGEDSACDDGADNDGDGLSDYPDDPGCSSLADSSEADNVPPPDTSYSCDDGIDNDGDGEIDYPADPGCVSETDGNEYDPPVDPPCTGDACNPPSPCTGEECTPSDEYPSPGDEPVEGVTPPTTDDPTTTPSDGGFFGISIGGPVLDAFIEDVADSGMPLALPAIIGLLAALLPLLLAASPSGVIFLPFQMWSLFFGRKKTKHPWGTVYDSITKRPLDPAYVVISKVISTLGNESSLSSNDNGTETGLHAQGSEKIGESITDIDGRYGFLVPGGSYVLTAGKTHYAFPSVKLAGSTKDELYDNLYFGGPINVAKDGDVILKNIPMDPLEFDWNEFRKSQMGLSSRYRIFDKVLTKLSALLFVVGCLFAILAYVIAPTVWNTVVLGLYILMILIRVVLGPLRPYGVVVEGKSKLPIAFAILRIFSSSGTEVAHKVTDEQGRYYSLLPKGTYTVSVEKKQDDESYQKVYVSGSMKIVKRYLNKKFSI